MDLVKLVPLKPCAILGTKGQQSLCQLVYTPLTFEFDCSGICSQEGACSAEGTVGQESVHSDLDAGESIG
jgi:hypothetical protein